MYPYIAKEPPAFDGKAEREPCHGRQEEQPKRREDQETRRTRLVAPPCKFSNQASGASQEPEGADVAAVAPAYQCSNQATALASPNFAGTERTGENSET